ncbi:MAG: uracil-DNA glycosylase [Patescibacteria group bacterium]
MTKQQKQSALDAIAEEIKNCETCKKEKVGVAVPGEGNPDADVVFIGEAPGKQEAASGRPFIGRSGKLLRRMITEVAELKEEDVFITSPVKYLPVHVTPTPEEVAHGRTHLMQQFDVIEPKIVVLLGRVAALAVLQENISVGKQHGSIIEKDGRKYLIAYHPAAALYSQAALAPLTTDFKKLKTLLKA